MIFYYEGPAELDTGLDIPNNWKKVKVIFKTAFEVIEFWPYEPANYCHEPMFLCEDMATGNLYFITQADLWTYNGKCLDCGVNHHDEQCPINKYYDDLVMGGM